MKKIRFIIALMSIISLFLAGCSSDDTVATTAAADNSTTASSTTDTKNERTNTPAKSTVSTPASMSASGSASSRTATRDDYADSAMVYPMIKAVVAQMKSTVSMADLNLMLVDARIAAGHTPSSTCYEKGSYSITFTQAMYNSLVAQEEDFGGEEGAEGSMSAEMSGFIGKDMDGPVAYIYDNISTAGYTEQISVGESCDNLNETYRWNDTDTKLASQFKDTDGTETYKGTFTYNGDDNVSSFSVEMSGSISMKLTLKMAACTGMTGDCAIYSFSQNFSDDSFGTMLMKADGKADDSGGYADARMSFSSGGMNMKMGYKEYWEGDGAVTASSTCTSNCDDANASWTTEGTTNDTYAEDSYDSDGANSVTVTVSGVTENGSYFLVITGDDPLTNPESSLGYGEIQSGQTFWDFWGPDKTIELDVYLINDDGTFTIQSGASVTLS
jgi:hypothetical protein